MAYDKVRDSSLKQDLLIVVIDANGDLVIDGNSVKSDQNDSITLDSLTDGAEVLSSLMGATEKASSFFQVISASRSHFINSISTWFKIPR